MKECNDLSRNFIPVLLVSDYIPTLGKVKVYRMPLPSDISLGFVLIIQYSILSDENDEYSSKEQSMICRTESEATLVAAKIVEDFLSGKPIL